MSADTDAFQTVQSLPGLTPPEQQYLLAVARGEGFYGLGWGNPSALTISKSEEMGIDPRAGVGSNNWGAEMGTGSAGSFPHVDTRSDGAFFVGKYRKHKTAAEGASSVARVLLKPNLRETLRTGFYPGPIAFAKPTPAQQAQFEYKKQFAGQKLSPLKAAVLTQSDNRYYELHPEKYLAAVTRNYGILTANLKWQPLLTREMIATTPLVLPSSTAGSLSSESPVSSSGEPSESPNANDGKLKLAWRRFLSPIKRILSKVMRAK